MKNLELRWKHWYEGRASHDPRPPINHKVLQYRERIKKEETVNLGDMESSVILVDVWGPWTNVPEVL